MGTIDLQVLIIVETHPYDAKQFRGEACEPRVVRSTGLSRRGKRKAASAHPSARATAEDFFHHVDHDVVDSRVENLLGLGLRGPDIMTRLVHNL